MKNHQNQPNFCSILETLRTPCLIHSTSTDEHLRAAPRIWFCVFEGNSDTLRNFFQRAVTSPLFGVRIFPDRENVRKEEFSKVVGSDGLYLLQFCILATVSDSEIDHSSNFMIMDVLNI